MMVARNGKLIKESHGSFFHLQKWKKNSVETVCKSIPVHTRCRLPTRGDFLDPTTAC
jgi:hypothetical protein